MPARHVRQISAHGVGQRLSERTEALAESRRAARGSVRRGPRSRTSWRTKPMRARCSPCADPARCADLSFRDAHGSGGVDYLDYGRDEWQTASATHSGFSRGRVARQESPDPNGAAALPWSTTCCPQPQPAAAAGGEVPESAER